MKGNKDIKTIMDDFFISDRLRPVLKSLVARNITDWETWLQIEFAHFLTNHESNPNWYREYELTSSESDEKTRPDFWIWSKQDKKYVLIEFKQAKKSHQLIEMMKKDTEKPFADNMVCTYDNERYEFAGQLFVGVFQKGDNSKLNLTGCKSEGEIKAIADTKYNYVVFSRTIKKNKIVESVTLE